MKDLGMRRLRRWVAPAPWCGFIVSICKWPVSLLLNNLSSTASKPTEQKKSMKKALITVTTLALLGATVPRASAHGYSGAAVAAGVAAGVAGGVILSQALQPQPVYAATPVYVNPAPVVVQQPQQVVVQQPTTVGQPVVVQQPAVVYQAAPVVYPAPVYVRPVYPAPVLSFGFSFGHPYYHHHGYYGHHH